MYLPDKYKNFVSDFPEILELYKALGAKVRESGPLDENTQNLIKLGIAIGSNSRGAVMSHTRKALESGSSKEMIQHAILMAIPTIGFPNMIAALNWANEVLEKEA